MHDPIPARPRPMTPFLVLWSGQALSLLGSTIVQFALIWWLTRETGSAAVLAMAALLGLLPGVVLGPVIGVLVDRWDRKRIMLAADGAVALASLVLAFLFATGRATPELVLAVLFVRGLGSAFHAPAMLASTSLLVPDEHLTRVQGLNQLLQGGMNIVSAPLGALVVALLPMSSVMLIDVVTALFAIVPLLFIAVPRPARSDVSAGESARSIGRDMVAGARYLGERKGHLSLVLMATLVNMCLVPAFSLLPLLVTGELAGDALALGWITSAFGVGTIVGGITLGVWGGTKRRILTALPALVGLGIAVAGVGLAPAFMPALVAMFAVGLLVPLANGPIGAILQSTIAPDYQGRVLTLMGSIATGAAPLGLLLAAPVAELVGIRAWYLAGGLACVAMGVLGFLLPALMQIEDPHAGASEAPGRPECGLAESGSGS